MDTPLGTLALRLTISGQQQVQTALAATSTAVQSTTSATKAAGSSAAATGAQFSGMSLPLMQVAGAAGTLAAAIGMVGAGFYKFSGLQIAGQYQRLQVGFTTLLGSAKAARTLMADLREVGSETPFNTMQLVQYSRTLLAMGSTAKDVAGQIRALANTGAAVGLNDAELGNLTRMMSELRMRPRPEIREIGALGAAGLPLVQTVNAGTGKNFQTPAQAEAFLSSMTGQKAFDVLQKGMEKAFGGAASANAGTFLGVMENLNEAWQNVMLPTGEALIPVFTAVGAGLKYIGQALGWLNEQSHGMIGLGVIVASGIRLFPLFVTSVRAAYNGVLRLTAAMEALAATASTAAAATGVQATANGASAATAGAGAAVATGGMMARAMGFLKGVGPWLIAAIAGELIGGAIGGRNGEAIKTVAGATGTGAAVGGLFGPEGIPIGAGIGAAIGVAKAAWDWTHNDASKETAANTREIADTLQNIHSALVGGGQRSAGVSTQIELQVARMMATGMA